MTKLRAALETIHLTLLGLWAGAIAATGLAAAVAFPIMKRLDPSLPEFAAYPQDHWRIAAGQAMNPVFQGVGWFGVVAGAVACLALTALLCVHTPRGRGALMWFRQSAALGALLCVVWSTVFVQASMQTELGQFISSAKAGDAAAADRHREAFDELHPVASNLMKANLGLVLLAFVPGVWSVARAAGAKGREGTP